MGTIHNHEVEETKLYSAYGFTAYGKINSYKWTIADRIEKCLVTIRITDCSGKNLINLYLGNRHIFMENFNATIDNFLYWIKERNPDTYMIEEQVFKSLCVTDSLFNYSMENLKRKHRKEAEERQRAEEREKQKMKMLEEIRTYCKSNDLLLYRDYEEVYLIQVNDKYKRMVYDSITSGNVQPYIKYAMENPDNKDIQIVVSGYLEDVYENIVTME